MEYSQHFDLADPLASVGKLKLLADAYGRLTSGAERNLLFSCGACCALFSAHLLAKVEQEIANRASREADLLLNCNRSKMKERFPPS